MVTAESMPSLSLAPHVRACISDGQVVLLDLRRSRYLSMGNRASHALAARIWRWPCAEAPESTPPTAAAVEAAVKRLLDLELVCASRSASALEPTLPPASKSIDLDAASATAHVGTPELICVLLSSVSSAWWLRRRSLDEIVSKVTTWHAGASSRGRLSNSGIAELDTDRGPVDGQANTRESSSQLAPRHGSGVQRRSIEDAALVFEKLRPLAFSTKDCCLRDSLALTRFLALQGLHARWVIGIKTRPFGAHAWVQHDSLVLNDHHEHVSGFRPILVV